MAENFQGRHSSRGSRLSSDELSSVRATSSAKSTSYVASEVLLPSEKKRIFQKRSKIWFVFCFIDFFEEGEGGWWF